MSRLKDYFCRVIGWIDWLPALVSRITLGFIFVESGWGKLHHLDKVIQFFESLHIPAPQLQAPLVAGIELVCGALILIGLVTRLAAIPLLCTMIVATITARIGDVSTFSDFLSLSEYLFIVLLLWLIVKGAGAVSLDAWISCRCGTGKENPGPASPRT